MLQIKIKKFQKNKICLVIKLKKNKKENRKNNLIYTPQHVIPIFCCVESFLITQNCNIVC